MAGWNYAAMVCGPPEHGKTSIIRKLVRRHLTTTNGIVLAHDPNTTLGRDGLRWYADANAYRVAAREAHANKTPLPRGAALGGEVEDVMLLAVEIGERAGNRDKHVPLPILAPVDEASEMEDSGSTYMGKADKRMLSRRRHRGVGCVYNLQQATQLMGRFWMYTTDAYLFVQTSDDARMLDRYLLLEKGTLERAGVTRLPMHNYLHVRRGHGIVGDAL